MSEPLRKAGGAKVTADKTSLADEVYGRLAYELMSGALEPGTRLKIRDLAEKMGVSVTPVRDAVLRLVNNGGLLFQSPRDIRVPLLERSRYLEIRTIRLELEGLAAEKAAQLATLKDIARLEHILEANERAMDNSAHLQAMRMNQQFHLALPAIAGMATLSGLLENLWLQMGPLISSGYQAGGRVMIDHHYAILQAIRNADGVAARAAIRNDIMAGGEVLLSRGALAVDGKRAWQSRNAATAGTLPPRAEPSGH